jgi:RHS repeat-associated protein
VTSDGFHTYQYDGENRLVGLDGTDVYAYDYQNRRIKKTVGSTNLHYIWDGNQVLAEHNSTNGGQVVDYVYAGTKLVGEGPGNLLNGNGSFTFAMKDGLSVRHLLAKSGSNLGVQSHLPFGEEFVEVGTQEKHHFTTYESDPESGTDYAENRQYAQGMGRFMRVDPVSGTAANPQSWDRYAYTMGDPVNSTDPTGLCLCPLFDGHCFCPDPPSGPPVGTPYVPPQPGNPNGPCTRQIGAEGASPRNCKKDDSDEAKCFNCLQKKYYGCLIAALTCEVVVAATALGIAIGCVSLTPIFPSWVIPCLVALGVLTLAAVFLCLKTHDICQDDAFDQCPDCKGFVPPK